MGKYLEIHPSFSRFRTPYLGSVCSLSRLLSPQAPLVAHPGGKRVPEQADSCRMTETHKPLHHNNMTIQRYMEDMIIQTFAHSLSDKLCFLLYLLVLFCPIVFLFSIFCPPFCVALPLPCLSVAPSFTLKVKMSNFPISLLSKYDCVFKIDSSFPVILYRISGKEWDGWMPFGLCVFVWSL